MLVILGVVREIANAFSWMGTIATNSVQGLGL